MRIVFASFILLVTSSCCLGFTVPSLTEEPKDAFGIDNKPLTLRCRTSSNPRPTFIWYKDSNELTGSRYRFTADGDLEIPSFSDSLDVGTYKCEAKFVESNRLLKLVSRNAKVQVEVPPTLFASDVTDTTAYAGGSLRLTVSTSNFVKAPYIAWNYRGKESIREGDPRFFALPQGVLQISDLSTADEGQIRALARTKTSQKLLFGNYAKITIMPAASRPGNNRFSFIGKPVDTDLNWGESVILEAFADSDGPIQYTWYKDGRPVTLGGSKSIVGKGNLKIIYAKAADSGIYKVIAKSGGRTLETSAKLTVISSPAFTKVPPSRITSVEGGTATANFEVTGSSKLNWFHDGLDIGMSSADYLEFGSDFLLFKDLIKEDAGMYQARVGNSDTQMSFQLVVNIPATTPPTASRNPLLPGKAQNVVAEPKSTTEIDLKWQEPLITNGVITSYTLTYFNTAVAFQTLDINDPTQRFARVSNLKPGTTYKFRLQAVNNQGTGLLSDVVEAKTFDLTPGVVSNVQTSVSGRTLTVTWNPPNRIPLGNQYIVFYTPQGFNGKPKELPVTGTTATIDDLSPGMSYLINVAVKSGNQIGPNSPYLLVNIPNVSKPPPRPVTNVVVTPVLTTLANVNWEPPIGGPPPTSYKVFYRKTVDPISAEQSKTVMTTVTNIQSLQPNAMYSFRVVPYNGIVQGESSTVTEIKTMEEPPPIPNSFIVVWTGSNQVKVQWEPIKSENFRGELLSYKLQHFEPGLKQSTLNVIADIPASMNEWKIENLKPETTYNVNVRGVGGGGQGSQSSTLQVKTRAVTTKGPSPPTIFTFYQDVNMPDVIMFNWDAPRFVTNDVKSYIIHYKQKSSPVWISKTMPGTANGFSITDVQFGKNYESYILAVDGNGQGQNSNVQYLTAFRENSPPDPVLDLKVVTKPDSLGITWVPPSESSPIAVRGYEMVIKDAAGDFYQETFLGRKNIQKTVYNGISANTAYTVMMKTFNAYGSSSAVSNTVTTLPAPKAAILVTKVKESASEMLFEWKDQNFAPGTSYDVRYNIYDVNGVPKTIIETVATNSLTAKQLTPYTNYDFFVKRSSASSFAADATLEAQTLEAVPSAPLDVTARGVAKYPTWLILSWQVPRYPNGKIQEYVIQYSAKKNLPYSEWPKINTKSISMTHNITRLTAGTEYTFVLYAVNGAGAGALSAPYSKTTVSGGGVVIVPGGNVQHHHAVAGDPGLGLWWIILAIILFIIFVLLLLLLLWCCCCRKKGIDSFWACCPCCEKCWLCCCLPCCLFCCPCCCKKKKANADKMYIAAPVLTVTTNEKLNGHTQSNMWNPAKKNTVEMIPLTSAVDGGDVYAGGYSMGGGSGMGSLSQATSRSSLANIKVPVPGDTTFISYKTSLQDYCQKIGWNSPIYRTDQFETGCQSKVSFGGIHAYDSGGDFGTSKQDAEQRSAHVGLIGLGVLDYRSKYNGDSCIAVPGQGDASFISYKCSLHDFCQQCNILPPRFVTAKQGSGYTSSVQVGSHTFNMSGLTDTSQEAEQNAASVALQGLCMEESKAVYSPQACFTVPGPGDISFISFKSSLHDFCQRYKLPPPQYITNQGSHGYSAKLKFGGLFFQSSDYFQTRLEAEQHAAFEALQGLGLLESSIDFSAAWESNSGFNRSNSMMHGSGVITVGSVGGSVPTTYSRQTSRQHSRTGSRSTSRQGSRPDSRQGSRSGSLTNVADGTDGVRLPPAPSVHLPGGGSYGMGVRSLSSGSGFNRTTDFSAQYAAVGSNNTSGYNTGSSAYSAGVSGTSNVADTLSSTGYNEGSVQQQHQSSKFEHNQGYSAGSTSKFNYTMSYQSNSASATLPRKQTSQMTSSSFTHYAGSRSYSGSTKDVSYADSRPTARSTSHPALSDLESEMAGLEGLIKDLNGITSSGKVV